jgi:hypothetical protein
LCDAFEWNHANEGPEQHGLAGAVRSQDRERRSAFEMEAQVPQDRRLPKANGKMTDLEDVFHGSYEKVKGPNSRWHNAERQFTDEECRLIHAVTSVLRLARLLPAIDPPTLRAHRSLRVRFRSNRSWDILATAASGRP